MKAKSHQGTGTPRSGTVGIIVLLAVAGLLLVALPARILECDAVISANGAIHNDPAVMIYPHHLAYNYMLRGAALIGQGLDPPLNPIYLLQYVGIAAGLGGVYLLYRMLMEIGAGPRRALLLSGVLLFSYGYWHYARQADAHIISAFLLIWATWAFYRFLAQPTIAAGCVVGLSLGLATFIHQSNILIFVPVLLACILRGREGIRLLRQTGAVIVVYFLIGILPYLLIGRYVVGAGTPAEFRKWLLGISLWENWGIWRLETVPATVIGIVRNFTGSHYLLGFQPLVHLAQRLFPIASLEDEMAIAASVPSRLHPWTRIGSMKRL